MYRTSGGVFLMIRRQHSYVVPPSAPQKEFATPRRIDAHGFPCGSALATVLDPHIGRSAMLPLMYIMMKMY